MRQHPDIIILRHIPHFQTPHIPIKPTQTPHIVFSTFHTNNPPPTLSPIFNIPLPPFNIPTSLTLIIPQPLFPPLSSTSNPQLHRPPL
ncbi:ATPase, T2SS/T4P/T4SS family, partial [Neisseria sicca]|uniref:ATPase, T2SS/T4P/T4SS family n=1 Tax=Neisseria sicca TaxID=490 RepID=UPI0034D97B59